MTSWAGRFGAPSGAVEDGFASWDLLSGESEWVGENRWRRTVLRDRFPRLNSGLAHQDPKGRLTETSGGTWSTAGSLPVAGVESRRFGAAWAWQVEHNGAWRWEVGEDRADGYFAVSGPTEDDHSFTLPLAPGAEFRSVPATVALGTNFEAAIGELTEYRRAARRPHPDNAAMPIVFNDYMNTLNGDPTTEKLLPLIDAAAEAGAEVFCIDAGWYDDGGQWWDSVGEWLPSQSRFPSGLGEVIDHIRAAGMVPGLWLEPEVVGVRSPLADRLPADAFFTRRGRRVVEHRRYSLDLRHPAVVAHLDSVVDRLVGDFGVGYFKFDYNIDPGAGTDTGSSSIGAGLVEHNRAHLAWLDRLLDRHPAVIIENCASGAMRQDFAMLSRLQLQSTSDQQDLLTYPPIAAGAPLVILPEQAANWAYPQPEMTLEEIAFCLVTGLAGRFYLSGFLSRMAPEQRDLVREAVECARAVRGTVRTSRPFWPLGLPGWADDQVALGLRTSTADLVPVWNRGPSGQIELALPHRAGREVDVEVMFPTSLPEWPAAWDRDAGVLRLDPGAGEPAARLLRVTERG